MWSEFVGKEVRRCNQNLLVANLLLLAAVAGVALANWHYLTSWFGGAVTVAPGWVAALTPEEALHGPFVRFYAGEVAPSGYREVSTSSSGGSTVKAEFLVTRVSGHVLVIAADPGMTGNRFEGRFEAVPGKVLEGLRADFPSERADLILPFMLQTRGYREGGWWMLAFGVPGIALSAWNLLKWRRRATDPLAHPIVRDLGGEQALLTYGQALDADLATASARYGSATLGESWLVVRRLFHAQILRIEDLAWAYKQTTKRSVNFIPVRKSHAAVVWHRTGARASVEAAEDLVELLLLRIAQRAPWVIVGYTRELETAWKRDRATVLQEVERRRQQTTGTGAGAQ